MNTNTTLTIDGANQTFAHDARVSVYLVGSVAWARCSCCDRADKVSAFNGAKIHQSWCDLRGTTTVRAATSAPTATRTTPVTERASTATFRRAVREGAIGSVATDDEIVDAVRCGFVSMSDAMNRDG